MLLGTPGAGTLMNVGVNQLDAYEITTEPLIDKDGLYMVNS